MPEPRYRYSTPKGRLGVLLPKAQGLLPKIDFVRTAWFSILLTAPGCLHSYSAAALPSSAGIAVPGPAASPSISGRSSPPSVNCGACIGGEQDAVGGTSVRRGDPRTPFPTIPAAQPTFFSSRLARFRRAASCIASYFAASSSSSSSTTPAPRPTFSFYRMAGGWRHER